MEAQTMGRTGQLEGFDIKMGLRFPDDVAARIIVESRKRKQPESVIVTEALRTFWEIGLEAQSTQPAPVGKSLQPTKVEKKEKPKKLGPRPAPPVSEEEELRAEGYPLTWDRLSEALASCGSEGSKYGLQRDLAKHLNLSNISVWATSGVPKKWWPGIRAFLQARGWVPPQEQQTIFGQEAVSQ